VRLVVAVGQVTPIQDQMVVVELLVILVVLVVDQRKVEVLLGVIFQMELLGKVLVVLVLLMEYQVLVVVEVPVGNFQIQMHKLTMELLVLKCLPGLVL
tara:strand:+ start:236 stop:529 length:294 start_codon:yes stop_codon:yes gene_type:complete